MAASILALLSLIAASALPELDKVVKSVNVSLAIDFS
jgi:hypothetical protein